MSQLQKETVVENSRGLGFHYGYIILIIGVLTVTGALGFARFGYATIVPSMKASLLLNNTQMGAIATGNLIGYTAFSLIGGFLAAKYGSRQTGGATKVVPGSRPDAAEDGKSLVWGDVYASPAMWHLGFVYLFFGFEYIIYGTFFSAAQVSDKGFTQTQAGAMWALAGAIGI